MKLAASTPPLHLMRLRYCLAATFLGLVAAPLALAQAPTLTWTVRTDLTSTLPESMKVFEVNDDSIPIKAWYVEADLSRAENDGWTLRGLLADDGFESTTQFAADARAFVAINAGYFGGGQSYSFVADADQVLVPNIGALSRSAGTYYPTRSAIGLLDDGSLDVAWIYNVAGETIAYPTPSPNTESAPQPQPSASFPEGGAEWPIFAGVGGGPVLVEDGESMITWAEEAFFGSGIGTINQRNPRTAAGYTADGKLILMVVDGRQTASRGASLVELAQWFIDLGAVEAINLDGGGSSTFVVGQTLVNRPEGGNSQRSVASVLALAPPVPTDGGGDEGTIYDTGDACCYRETGGWIESANTPFWGETKARLNAAGDGSEKAIFTFNGIAAGTYRLDGWWVPSFNRSNQTPYTVYQSGVGTEVRVDQSDAGALNKWNEIGTFTLTPGDSVVISDDVPGTASTFVVADAVRLVKVTDAATETARERAVIGPIDVYPTPSAGRVTLRYTLGAATPSAARGEVVDLLGRTVLRFDAARTTGEHQQTLDASGLAPGVYAVRIASGSGVSVGRLIVAR